MGNSASTPGATGPESRSQPPGLAKSPDPPLRERSAAPGSRARQRADTRERIFEMALREFREVGFASAQIDRIAKNAGVARGTFYFHFPTKADVMLELARRINARILRRVDLIIDAGSPTLRELLLRLNDALIDEHARISEAGLSVDVLSLYMRRPEDLREAARGAPTLTDVVAEQLRLLADKGALRSALAPDALAAVIMSSLFGVLARIPPGEPVRQACGELIEVLVRGLGARS